MPSAVTSQARKCLDCGLPTWGAAGLCRSCERARRRRRPAPAPKRPADAQDLRALLALAEERLATSERARLELRDQLAERPDESHELRLAREQLATMAALKDAAEREANELRHQVPQPMRLKIEEHEMGKRRRYTRAEKIQALRDAAALPAESTIQDWAASQPFSEQVYYRWRKQIPEAEWRDTPGECQSEPDSVHIEVDTPPESVVLEQDTPPAPQRVEHAPRGAPSLVLRLSITFPHTGEKSGLPAIDLQLEQTPQARLEAQS